MLLLENTRFHAGEEENDPDFVEAVAALGDIFVNDAFSAAHRAHATTEGLAHLLPSAAGRSMQAELSHLHKALDDPERPVMAVVGGAKVSTKIALLEHLVKQGRHAGDRRRHGEHVPGRARHRRRQIAVRTRPFRRPRAASSTRANETGTRADPAGGCGGGDGIQGERAPPHRAGARCPHDEMILDVGPKTIEAFERRLQTTATLVWNGPFGAFETRALRWRHRWRRRKLVAERTQAGKLLSVAGGGDTVAALNHAGVADDFTYVSTAGGAFLEWLEGQELPGVAALGAARKSEDGSSQELNSQDRERDGGEGQGHSGRRRKLRHDQEALRRDRRRESTEDNRRDYREMLFRTADAMKNQHLRRHPVRRDHPPEGEGRHAAGQADRGRGLRSRHQGRRGREAAGASPGETITEGLDGLRERLVEYHKLGARFAKWRAA